MQTNLIVLLLFAGLGCNSDRSGKKPCDLDNDTNQIRSLLTLIHPVMQALCHRTQASRHIEMISYHVLKDHLSGRITIGNFRKEQFFPIASRSEYMRLAGEIYAINCPSAGPSDMRCLNLEECIKGIKQCLNIPGKHCPSHYTAEMQEQDYEFFERRRLGSTYLQEIRSLPAFTPMDTTKLSTVKLYTLIL